MPDHIAVGDEVVLLLGDGVPYRVLATCDPDWLWCVRVDDVPVSIRWSAVRRLDRWRLGAYYERRSLLDTGIWRCVHVLQSGVAMLVGPYDAPVWWATVKLMTPGDLDQHKRVTMFYVMHDHGTGREEHAHPTDEHHGANHDEVEVVTWEQHMRVFGTVES